MTRTHTMVTALKLLPEKCAKKESVECDACHKKEVVTDECDCDEPVCKFDERLGK